MDTARTRGASPPRSSRLPTKKNSFHTLRESKENIDRHALATSPSAISDTSSGPETAGGNGGQYGLDSRRSSSSSQQSDVRGQTTRIPRPSPSQTPLPTLRRPLSIKDAYRMAEEHDAAAVAKAAQGSPSPAPRPWRSRAGGSSPKGTPTPAAAGTAISGRATPISASESRMQKILAQSPLDIGGRRTARRIAEPLFHGDQQPRSPRRSADDDDARSVASNSTTAHSEHGDGVDLRRVRYEEDQARMQVTMGEKSGGLFSPKARVSPKIAVAGRELHRRASNSSLGEKSKVPVSVTTARTALPGSHSTLGSRGKPGSYLKRMVSAPENVAPNSEDLSADLESINSSGDLGYADPPSAARLQTGSATVPALVATKTVEEVLNASPGKSFAWDADEDFTAGDLMASESPRVEIRGRLGVSDDLDTQPTKSPQSRPRNTKLDEIRRLELEAELIFPDECANDERHGDPDEILPRSPNVDKEKSAAEKSEASPQPPRRPGLPAERTNKAIDEIRAREDVTLSRRAISAAKLDEVRQRNAERRAAPLDAARKLSHEHLRAEMARGEEDKDDLAALAARDRTLFGEEGERIPNTPITIFRTSSTDRGRKLLSGDDGGSDNDTAKNVSVSPAASRRSLSTHSRTESQELLRRLARVTTSAVAAAERKDKPSTTPGRLSERASGDNLRGIGSGTDVGTEKSVSLKLPRSRDADTLRPTVGFAQLRRVSSTESASTKRSSVAQSDGDPTDRIEAEMKLFAATENHSERGSIRAPSPDEDDDENTLGAKGSLMADDATPRPAKTNPLMLPTPRVTGAYVETPVTARTEKIQEVINVPTELEPAKTAFVATKAEKRTSVPFPGIMSLLRSSTVASSTGVAETAAEKPSDNGRADDELAATKREETRLRRMSASRQRSRSRSTSRARTPLMNSAKPASARDDLLAIQRDQQIDDSTLDDFDEILATRTAEAPIEKAPSSSSSFGPANNASAVDERDSRRLRKEARKNMSVDDGTTDSERLRRMSQSISTYIFDVQTAKKGIERLEDHVSHPEKNGGALAELDKEVVEEQREETRATTKNTGAVTEKSLKKEEEGINLDLDGVAPAKLTQHKRQSSRVASVVVPKKEEADVLVPVSATALATPPTVAVTVSYVRIPLPRLYRSNPDTQLTFLGMLVLLLSVWLAAESTACAFFCRPDACQSGQLCQWSPDDPSFGVAVPVKLDQWLTGGKGRVLTAWAADEIGDLVADAWDAATDTDIRQVDSTYFTFDEKRRHRRRLQKKGLVQPWTPPAEARPKLEAWRRAREAREQETRTREELNYGYSYSYGGDDDGDDYEGVGLGRERMMGDEKVGGWWWSPAEE